jgi:hypothetical protein
VEENRFVQTVGVLDCLRLGHGPALRRPPLDAALFEVIRQHAAGRLRNSKRGVEQPERHFVLRSLVSDVPP